MTKGISKKCEQKNKKNEFYVYDTLKMVIIEFDMKYLHTKLHTQNRAKNLQTYNFRCDMIGI